MDFVDIGETVRTDYTGFTNGFFDLCLSLGVESVRYVEAIQAFSSSANRFVHHLRE